MADNGDGDNDKSKKAETTYAFEKELTNRQNDHFRVANYNFQPDFKAERVTGKFWSRHNLDFPLDPERFGRNFQKVNRHIQRGPREKYPAPILDSHNDGWFHQHQVLYDKWDRKLFYFPKDCNEITRIGEKLTIDKITLRPSFGGLPFRLQ